MQESYNWPYCTMVKNSWIWILILISIKTERFVATSETCPLLKKIFTRICRQLRRVICNSCWIFPIP